MKTKIENIVSTKLQIKEVSSITAQNRAYLGYDEHHAAKNPIYIESICFEVTGIDNRSIRNTMLTRTLVEINKVLVNENKIAFIDTESLYSTKQIIHIHELKN